MRWILIEEAIRAIALIGVLVFIVWPICYVFGFDMNRVAPPTLLLPLLSFLVLVPLRGRARLPFAVTGWRGVLALAGAAYVVWSLGLLAMQVKAPALLSLPPSATVVTMLGTDVVLMAWTWFKVWQLDRWPRGH